MDHAEPLSRSIFREVVVRLAAPGAGLDFAALARDAYAAADAYEAEGVRRLKAEQEPVSVPVAAPIADLRQALVDALAKATPAAPPATEQGAQQPAGGEDGSADAGPGAACATGEDPEAPRVLDDAGRATGSAPPANPSPRWGTVQGRPVAYQNAKAVQRGFDEAARG